MKTEKADSTIQTYVKTYSCYGNEEIGLLAGLLYGMKNPYVGNMPANEIILNTLNIRLSFGSYQNELQTGEEPYGWTLKFKDFVAEADEEEFNHTIKGYAYILLALIGNLGEVSWTYQTENGAEIKEMTVTAEEASDELGEDIKGFSDSQIKVQELLFAIGME
jgi:hypothetical protein